MLMVLALGIALAVFGALVLLWFPDRPGGKVAWRGMEVSSTGAGLPLIALGVLTATVGAWGLDGTSPPSTGEPGDGRPRDASTRGNCLSDLLAEIPEDRIANVHSGASDQDVIGPTQSKQGPVALVLHEGGETLGAVTFQFFAESGVFDVDQVVDASCRPLEGVQSTGHARDTVPNFGDLTLPFESATYLLNLAGGADIEVDFHQVAL